VRGRAAQCDPSAGICAGLARQSKARARLKDGAYGVIGEYLKVGPQHRSGVRGQARSAAGMVLGMERLQPLARHMRIDLRRR
jgi:hypothetical protein